MDDANPILLVNQMVERAEEYLDEQSKYRDQALAYYKGDPSCIPYNEGRSFSVSKDLRSVVRKLMPSVMRTIFGSDKAVRYEPVGPGDEDAAEQASDYVNYVVMRKTQSRKAIESAIWDALILKTGVLEWCAVEKTKVVVTDHVNIPDDQALGLIDGSMGEVLDYEKEPETDEEILAIDPNAMRHTFKLRRKEKEIVTELRAVPRGSFLITPGASSIADAPLVGKKMEASRSDLVAQGYAKEDVDRLPRVDRTDDDDFERMGDDWTDLDSGASKAAQDVEYYEVYARLDYDGDGIAELYHVVYGVGDKDGKGAERYVILQSEPCDEAPFSEVVAENSAHQFEGHSVYEDIEDVMRIKTVLLRATLDNLNWQNNAQRAVVMGKVLNPEAVTNPQFGQDIQLKDGTNAREAVQPVQVPFFAANSFQMLQYMDEVREDRTGITDASGGIDPEGFQNMSATAAHLAAESGVAVADMIVRNLAEGIQRAFRGLLKLIVAHSDKSEIVRLRDQWVEFRPDSWNADMDCTVNVGLGGGTRERDMAMLQIILGLQREIFTSLGPINPLVKPDQLYSTLEKITEAAGFASADPYFTRPDPQEVAAAQQQGQQGNQAEVQKLQLDAQKMKADQDLARFKAEEEAKLAREKAQAEMGLARERFEFEKNLAVQKMQMQALTGNSSNANLGGGVRMGGAIG